MLRPISKFVCTCTSYTGPLCGPSRALILTGRYAFRTGATNQDATGRMKNTVEIYINFDIFHQKVLL